MIAKLVARHCRWDSNPGHLAQTPCVEVLCLKFSYSKFQNTRPVPDKGRPHPWPPLLLVWIPLECHVFWEMLFLAEKSSLKVKVDFSSRARMHAQSYPTPCDPMDCSPPGSSVHGIFQARVPKWVAMSYTRGSSQPRDRTHVSCISCISRWVLYHWATQEAQDWHVHITVLKMDNKQGPGIPDHLTYLLRNLYAGQEATVRTRHGTMDWFKIVKGIHQGCMLSPCLINLYAEYIMWNARLDEAQAGIRIAWRNINDLRYADDTTFMAESEELKSLLMKVKEESEKAGLKLNIQKTKIMASSPITSWQIDGETMETVTNLIFLGSKITADGNCSHEIKRHLLLWKKAMTNLDNILKSRDITLLTKVRLVRAMVFPVVIYGCESWTIKKAEHWRIDAFELGVGEVSWESCELQDQILKEINLEYSFEGLCWTWSSNTLSTWFEKQNHWKRPWCWERLRAGGDRGRQKMR